jgi:hypothetical protein
VRPYTRPLKSKDVIPTENKPKPIISHNVSASTTRPVENKPESPDPILSHNVSASTTRPVHTSTIPDGTYCSGLDYTVRSGNDPTTWTGIFVDGTCEKITPGKITPVCQGAFCCNGIEVGLPSNYSLNSTGGVVFPHGDVMDPGEYCTSRGFGCEGSRGQWNQETRTFECREEQTGTTDPILQFGIDSTGGIADDALTWLCPGPNDPVQVGSSCVPGDIACDLTSPDYYGLLDDPTKRPLMLCGQPPRHNLPFGACYTSAYGEGGGTVSRGGVKMSLMDWCAEMDARPPCDYVSAANLNVMAVPVTTLLVTFDLPPLPSLDQTICSQDKEEIILKVIELLDVVSGSDLNILDGDMTPLETARYFLSTTGTVGNLADFAKAAIQFGRGEFGESVLNLLQALPIWGNIIGDIFDKLGIDDLLSYFVDKLLSEEQKQQVIDLAITIIDVASEIPNPASPILKPLGVVLVSMIMFGRKQWDEAVLNMLMMGLGAMPSGKPVQGPVTAAGVPPTKAATNAFEKLLMQLRDIVTPIIEALKKPLQKLAFDNGYVDAAGKLTIKGEQAKIAAAAAGAAFEWLNGGDIK